MAIHEEAQRKAASTYNSASDHFDDPANSFWDRFGRRTIERLRLNRGARVLDVCCGSGASAIPAAEAVGPEGSVLGLDLAEKMLDLGRNKANRLGLGQIEFRVEDMLDLPMTDASFDAVVCVFGIFFVPDMQAAARELWRLVKPGGKLAVTTWGPGLFEPANTAFWNAIRDLKPELYKGFNPWDRICEPEAVRAMLEAASITNLEVVAELGSHPIRCFEDWWAVVLGSGLRGTLDQLDENSLAIVKQRNMDFVSESGLQAIEANVVYAVATKR